jgi:hypothetical protein
VVLKQKHLLCSDFVRVSDGARTHDRLDYNPDSPPKHKRTRPVRQFCQEELGDVLLLASRRRPDADSEVESRRAAKPRGCGCSCAEVRKGRATCSCQSRLGRDVVAVRERLPPETAMVLSRGADTELV